MGGQWSPFGGSGHSEPPRCHCGHERGWCGEGKEEFCWWMWGVHSPASLHALLLIVVADTTQPCCSQYCSASSPLKASNLSCYTRAESLLGVSQISPPVPPIPLPFFLSNYLLLPHLILHKAGFFKCYVFPSLHIHIHGAFPLRSLSCSQKVSLCWEKGEKLVSFLSKFCLLDETIC